MMCFQKCTILDTLREIPSMGRCNCNSERASPYGCVFSSLLCAPSAFDVASAKCKKPKAGFRPIVTNGFGVRGQVDLIDFQSMPDGNFNFLLNYVDHGIKFCVVKPLHRKTAKAVAYALYDTFTLIGCPQILQTDNGREFKNKSLVNAKKVDLELKRHHICLCTSRRSISLYLNEYLYLFEYLSQCRFSH